VNEYYVKKIHSLLSKVTSINKYKKISAGRDFWV